MKLWGRADSANVQKVAWCLDELGLRFERIDIGGRFGGNRSAEYLAMNPNGLVPTLQDGNHVFWESNAILRYLNSAHGEGRLLPADPAARCLAERWMDWQLSALSPAVKPLYNLLLRQTPSPEVSRQVEEGTRRLVALMQILEAQLARTTYLGGGAFSLGDIPVAIQTYRWFTLPLDRPDLPQVARWYGLMLQRPAFVTNVSSIPLA